MLLVLYSAYVWIVWTLCLVVLAPPIALLMMIVPKHRKLPLAQFFVGTALGLVGIKAVGKNLDQVDWDKPQIYMSNHESLLDHFALCLLVRRHIVGVEKKESHSLPFYGAMARAWGNIPVDRKDPEQAREAIAIAVERIKQGDSIIILPEGTRARDGMLAPFKKGGFHMAVDSGADILPFTINGAYELSPGAAWRVRPGTIEIVFGESIPTAGYGKGDVDALSARVRQAIIANMRDAERRVPELAAPAPAPSLPA